MPTTIPPQVEDPRGGVNPSARKSITTWILSIVAVFVVLAVVAWGLNDKVRTVASDPAVIATPAPAAGVPAPSPETTKGQPITPRTL